MITKMFNMKITFKYFASLVQKKLCGSYSPSLFKPGVYQQYEDGQVYHNSLKRST